jgi:hypothetical protein
VEEEEQRVVDAEWLPADKQSGLPGAQLRVTLLAAGFVIGASGASVRELSQKTRTTIQSWTEKHSRVWTVKTVRPFAVSRNQPTRRACSA